VVHECSTFQFTHADYSFNICHVVTAVCVTLCCSSNCSGSDCSDSGDDSSDDDYSYEFNSSSNYMDTDGNDMSYSGRAGG
jgi:hypothetical protein